MHSLRPVLSSFIAVASLLLILFAPEIISAITRKSFTVPDSDELKKLPFGKRY